MGNSNEMDVRSLLRKDVEDVIAIEQSCFSAPWSPIEFAYWRKKARVRSRVATIDGNIVAFAIYQLRKRSAEVINIATDPDHQRQGAASLLLQHIITTVEESHRSSVRAEVSEWLLPAQLCLRTNGFYWTRTIQDGSDDFYNMQFDKKPTKESGPCSHYPASLRSE